MATTHTDSPATGQEQNNQGTVGMIGKVRERATAELTNRKDKAIDGIGSVTQAVRQSSKQLREQEQDTLAGYVERAADQIDRLSQQLRNKDVGELLEDAQRLARRQPALFIGSAFALGLVGARFLKSSSSRDEEEYGQHWYGRAEPGDGTFAEGTSRNAARDYTSGSAGYTGGNAGDTGAGRSGVSTGFGGPSGGEGISGTSATGGDSFRATGATGGSSAAATGGATGTRAAGSTAGSTATEGSGSNTANTPGSSRSRKSSDTGR